MSHRQSAGASADGDAVSVAGRLMRTRIAALHTRRSYGDESKTI
jgi:hypothetical protein